MEGFRQAAPTHWVGEVDLDALLDIGGGLIAVQADDRGTVLYEPAGACVSDPRNGAGDRTA
ncbi:hypothetical protein [Streptosporangium sp. NPDC049644]|uniref:hypothetical protein n=1 Tax=Streptosporangium sp. NPDC049644 TaxID=3155507 RepID=UPI0034216855